MGALQFAKNGNYKRFYENLKIIGKKEKRSPIMMFIDAAFCVIFTGSGLSDYLNYKFYQKNWKERKTYATIGYQADFYKIFGRDPEHILSNKVNFLKNYPELTRRDFYDCSQGLENLKKFLAKHKNFVIKPINGLGGTGVKKLNAKDIEDLEVFKKELETNNMYLEELIVQDKDWGKISPNSINTIRVMTSNINGKVKIFCMIARIGNSVNLQDNFHQGGTGVLIDTEKGILVGKATNKDMEEFISHPLTNIKFDGYKIPHFNEISNLCLEAAKKFPKTNVIGWDVAITDKGPLIIEGNNGPGFDLVQVVMNKGTKYMLKEIENQKK